jgi:hypothetical protein
MRLNIRRISGPLVIVLWQTAPMPVDSTGRYQVSFGLGTGSLENIIDIGCAGPSETRTLRHRTTGIRVDIMGSEPDGRLTVFGGQRHYTRESLAEFNPTRPAIGTTDWFGGAQLALERRYFGLGAGLAYAPTPGIEKSDVALMAMLRFGNKDEVHVRMDWNEPGVAFQTMGLARLGLGWRQGRIRSVNALGGLATFTVDPFDGSQPFESSVGGFLELGIPAGSRFDVMARAFLAPSNLGSEVWFVGLGGRLHF